MKKYAIGLLSLLFLFGAGKYVYATEGSKEIDYNTKQMEKQMKKMHAELTKEELNKMLQECRSNQSNLPHTNHM